MRTRCTPFLVALAAALVLAGPSVAGSRWPERRVLNIAHQGGEDEFPSNTMYAFRRALSAGADMLELDVGVTRDGHVVVMHDTSVDRTTNGHGFIKDLTLRRLERLDNAYWFAPGDDAYRHDRARRAYRLRGIATGRRRPPRGFRAGDFRVTTLARVLRAFPRTPINIEIKGRDRAETPDQYVRNAGALARTLARVHRNDIVVASFNQEALDRFHELLPRFALAPATAGAASYLLAGGSPGAGIRVFQMPITFALGDSRVQVTTRENVARAHRDGYAWHVWFSGERESVAIWNRMLSYCVDGLMTARPRALERLLDRRHIERPGHRGANPCRHR
jgi:glycerophosphoryl diester phosphodiesterase